MRFLHTFGLACLVSGCSVYAESSSASPAGADEAARAAAEPGADDDAPRATDAPVAFEDGRIDEARVLEARGLDDAGVDADAPTDAGKDGGTDGGTTAGACPASVYTFVFTRTVTALIGTALNPVGGGAPVSTTGTLRAWRPQPLSHPHHHYFGVAIAGEPKSSSTLVTWNALVPTPTSRSFAFGGAAGIADNGGFPFTGCYSGSSVFGQTDRNRGTLRLDDKAGTASLSVTCEHPVQTGPTLKDRTTYTTYWRGTGACAAP